MTMDTGLVAVICLDAIVLIRCVGISSPLIQHSEVAEHALEFHLHDDSWRQIGAAEKCLFSIAKSGRCATMKCIVVCVQDEHGTWLLSWWKKMMRGGDWKH